MNKSSFWEAILNDDCNMLLVWIEEVQNEDVKEALRVSALSEHHAFVYKRSDGLIHRESSVVENKYCFVLVDLSIIRIILEGARIREYWEDDINSFFDGLFSYCVQYGFEAVDVDINSIVKNQIHKESNGKILFWVSNIPSFANGTSIHALGVLEGLWYYKDCLPPIDVCMNKKSADIYI